MILRVKKVSGTFCQYGPEGAAHKRFLTPFSSRNGLTLLEVIVTLGLFVPTCVMVFYLFDRGLRAAEYCRAYTVAVQLAESKMAEVVGLGAADGSGTYAEDTEELELPQYPDLMWDVTLDPTEVEGLFLATVTVAREESNPPVFCRLVRWVRPDEFSQ